MHTRTEDDRDAAAFGLAGGSTAVVLAALAAAAVFAPTEREARLLVMATVSGVLARYLTDWQTSLAVTILAALIFIGFLTHRSGILTGDLTPWPHTAVIALATLLGRGYRRIRALTTPHTTPGPTGPAHR
ncbi:hypothetical protein [Actinoplanes sp. NPDC051851]|uniref:hypothetical protein n=1 Tax=Actinoplanes sp. NPDC051851 TaxID=3154753 RepID=UPI003419CD81